MANIWSLSSAWPARPRWRRIRAKIVCMETLIFICQRLILRRSRICIKSWRNLRQIPRSVRCLQARSAKQNTADVYCLLTAIPQRYGSIIHSLVSLDEYSRETLQKFHCQQK
ncbi:hypothetical protein O6H91_10G009800 [Diphasiastrum complanatum]|uniref:Uncharacterized protein n=1 Tax=Diphasiastrum complanatum TaxID=34168 RepID=A0ACC2CE94_DIPCM|nr:hypothetical protein O6H91_10G009800 [Diphasiastrum complanatum]